MCKRASFIPPLLTQEISQNPKKNSPSWVAKSTFSIYPHILSFKYANITATRQQVEYVSSGSK